MKYSVPVTRLTMLPMTSPDTSYYFNDDIYSTKTKLNGLFNWLFVFGNNQKIEFRNFFNQYQR